ncbi:MAG: methyltransferase domain-containing protein [Azospirillaceae bacterium]|nr:methyltransferase domain-containing protein [Azospirillaceae bacterium]
MLEQIDDHVGALRQVHRLLRPGGRLFLSVPAYGFLHSTEDVIAGHFRRYSRRSLTSVLAVSGFRVAFASYLFTPLAPLVFLLRTVPSRLGLHRRMDGAREAAEHVPDGWPARLMDRLLAAEYRRIDQGHPLSFGASCLCVAVATATADLPLPNDARLCIVMPN